MKQYSTTSECRNAAYSGVHPGKAGKALSAKARPAGAGWPLVTGRPGPGSACPPRSPCFSCDVPSGDTLVQQRAFGSLSGKGVEVSIVRGQNLISRFLSRLLCFLKCLFTPGQFFQKINHQSHGPAMGGAGECGRGDRSPVSVTVTGAETFALLRAAASTVAPPSAQRLGLPAETVLEC